MHCIGTLHLQQPNIAETSSLPRRGANSTEQSFDAKKVFVGQALCQCAKKRTLAATKIDVQWRSASKDLFQIELLCERITRLRDHSRTGVPAVS